MKISGLAREEKVKVLIDGKRAAKGAATTRRPSGSSSGPVRRPATRSRSWASSTGPGRPPTGGALTVRLTRSRARLAAAVLTTSAAGLGLRRGHVRSGRGGRLLGGDRRDGRRRPRLPRWRRRDGLQRRRRRQDGVLAAHRRGLLPDLRPAAARLRLPDQRPAGLRPVRQHASVGRLLGAVVVRREVRVVELRLRGRRVADVPDGGYIAFAWQSGPRNSPNVAPTPHASTPTPSATPTVGADVRWRRRRWRRARQRRGPAGTAVGTARRRRR